MLAFFIRRLLPVSVSVVVEMSRCDPQEVESEDDYEVDNEYFVPHGYLSDEEIKDEEEMMVRKRTACTHPEYIGFCDRLWILNHFFVTNCEALSFLTHNGIDQNNGGVRYLGLA